MKTEPVDPNEGKPRFKVSFDQTQWGCHAYFAFDGDTLQNGTGTWSTYLSELPDGYEWVEITYPEEITLDAVRLTVWDDGGNSRPPVSAGVQVWDEVASDWKDVANLKQPAAYVKGGNIITFDQVTGDRFRLTFTPTEGKWLAFDEIEMLEEMPSQNIEVTGYKYIAPDDKAAVVIKAKNLSEAPVEFEVAASSGAASTEDGAALTGTAAGFQLRIEGDEGFVAKDGNLVKAVTAAPGETVTFRVAMAFADDAADNAAPLASFFADSDPVATQKAAFNQWFLDTIPYVDLPDEQIKQIYYFRWYTYRNHIRKTTDDYYIISEFLPNVGWAGKHNSINCPAGHHVAEGRWLKNDQYLDDYLMHWLDRGGAVRSYSFWIANAYYERYLVNQDDYVLDYLEKLKNNYAGWDRERYDADIGLYYQYCGLDGMENAVGGGGNGAGYRPTINAYQYADAMAIAELCRLVGDEEGAAEYTQKAETLKAEYLGAMPQLIYALGNSTTRGDSNSGLFMSRRADGKYVWEGIMTYTDEDKCIKFTLDRGDWDKVTFLVPESVDHNGNVRIVTDGTYKAMRSAETEPGALKDWFWGIQKGKDGIYRFTVDPEALTVEVKRVKGLPGEFDPMTVTELYMNGLATGSFDSGNPGAKMTAKGNGVFEWEGDMDYSTDDGDAAHANKQFKFLTSKGDWNKVWYLVPSAAQADGYIEQVESGRTYDLSACSWIGGRSGIDAFFGLTPGASDKYTVTVDVPNMTMKIVGSKTGAVDAIDAEPEEILGVYTIDGREVDGDNLNAGIYIVRTDKGVKKIIKK